VRAEGRLLTFFGKKGVMMKKEGCAGVGGCECERERGCGRRHVWVWFRWVRVWVWVGVGVEVSAVTNSI